MLSVPDEGYSRNLPWDSFYSLLSFLRSVFHIIVCHFALFHLAIWLSVRSVFHIIVCHFVLFHLAIWLSVRLLFTSSGIFAPFLKNQGKSLGVPLETQRLTENQRRIHSIKFPSANITYGSFTLWWSIVFDFQLKMERNGHIKNKYHILENGSCDTE